LYNCLEDRYSFKLRLLHSSTPTSRTGSWTAFTFGATSQPGCWAQAPPRRRGELGTPPAAKLPRESFPGAGTRCRVSWREAGKPCAKRPSSRGGREPGDPLRSDGAHQARPRQLAAPLPTGRNP